MASALSDKQAGTCDRQAGKGARGDMSMNARRLALATLCALAGALVFAGAPAQAGITHPYTGRSFGPSGGLGTFANPEGVAVDQSSGEPTSGDVYVYDALAAGGSIYRFDSAGKPVEFSALKTNVITGVGGRGAAEMEIAVDSSAGPTKGDIYVANGSDIGIYGSSGAKLGELKEAPAPGAPWGEPCGVAVDPAGHVYVGLASGHVNRYAPAGNPVTNSDYTSSLWGLVGEVCNIAADAEGSVYADTWPHGPVMKYAALQFSPIEVAAVGTLVDKEGSTLAVDSVGKDLYIDERTQIAEYDLSVEPPGLLGTSGAAGYPGALSNSYGVAANHSSGEVYAANAETGMVEIFGPGVILADAVTEAATGLSDAAATLHGTVNPDGVAVSACKFEYGTEKGVYTNAVECSPAPGSGKAPVPVSAAIGGLTGGTTYYYRVAAVNVNGTGYGRQESFRTPGPLIANEAVSNVAGEAATLQAQIDPLGSDTHYYFQYGTSSCAASPSPCIDGPSLPGTDIGSAEEYVAVATRIQGLASHTTYHYRAVATNAFGTSAGPEQTFTTQPVGGKLVLPDGRAWELVSSPTKDGAEIKGREETIAGGGLLEAAQDGHAISYLATAPIGEPPGNISPELSQFISTRGSAGWSTQDVTSPREQPTGVTGGQGGEFVAFSPDLSSALVEPLEPPVLLSPEAAEGTPYLRNDASGGYSPLFTAANIPAGTNLRRECKSNPSSNHEFVGASPDLSHVVFKSCEALTPNSVRNGTVPSLYEWAAGGRLQLVSVLPNGKPENVAEKEQVDLGSSGIVSEINRYNSRTRHAVSDDGSRVIWRTESYFGDIYMHDLARDETVRVDNGNTGGMKPAFQIASSDGSKVFFTEGHEGEGTRLYEFEVTSGSGEPLAGKVHRLAENVESVESVIWASEDGSTLYISGSSGVLLLHNTGTEWTETPFPAVAKNPGGGHLRVSPNGYFVAFETNTGVSLYDASTGRVVCVSCSPTGEAAQGESNLPGWTTNGRGYQNPAVYQSRYLSDSGRLFFETTAALVPQDTNGQRDVYEYEPLGVGSCESTSVTFNEKAGGCVSLISSGTSSEASQFLDASESGADVFFLTTGRLTSQDYDMARDVYDAHACSASSPCFAPPPASPPACTTTDSCRAAPAPQPGIFGAPPSATFNGAGNLASAVSAPVSNAKTAGAQKLAKALKACKHKRKRKRAACEAQARKRYAVKSRAKRSRAGTSLSARTRR
jgi:hypothetical protein